MRASSSLACMIDFIRVVNTVSLSFAVSAAVTATASGSPSAGIGYTTVKFSLRGSGGTYLMFVSRKLAVTPYTAPTDVLISRFHATMLLNLPMRSIHSGVESFASAARLGGITLLSSSFNMSEIHGSRSCNAYGNVPRLVKYLGDSQVLVIKTCARRPCSPCTKLSVRNTN